jgi:hypothetical protein
MTITYSKKSRMFQATQGKLTYVGVDRLAVMKALTRAIFAGEHL